MYIQLSYGPQSSNEIFYKFKSLLSNPPYPQPMSANWTLGFSPFESYSSDQFISLGETGLEEQN